MAETDDNLSSGQCMTVLHNSFQTKVRAIIDKVRERLEELSKAYETYLETGHTTPAPRGSENLMSSMRRPPYHGYKDKTASSQGDGETEIKPNQHVPADGAYHDGLKQLVTTAEGVWSDFPEWVQHFKEMMTKEFGYEGEDGYVVMNDATKRKKG